MAAPLLILLAGPNGAGKSTFYESHLKALGLPFLNADILARELNIDSYTAADTIAAIRDQRISEQASFISETVFSDPFGEKVQVLKKAAAEGFDVTLIYIGLENPELSQRRVQARVAAGGHDVPVEKLAARYARSLDNLERAIQQLPRVRLYDNSSFANPHRFLGEFQQGILTFQSDAPPPLWAQRFLSQ
jgi:predicted ABC-type ATPase